MTRFITSKFLIVLLLTAAIPIKFFSSLSFGICDDREQVLKYPAVLEAFHELWQNSGTDLPMARRTEQGGWIVENQERGYEVIPFPPEWSTSPCYMDFPPSVLDMVPENLAGIVHTHPFYEGDDTTSPDVCGDDAPGQYKSGGNYDDLKFLVMIANHLSDFCIKSYVIDGDHIVSMTTWGELVFYPAGNIARPLTVASDSEQ